MVFAVSTVAETITSLVVKKSGVAVMEAVLANAVNETAGAAVFLVVTVIVTAAVFMALFFVRLCGSICI